MKANALLTILILLCSNLNALASVLPTPRHVQLNKRDININFNDFENFEFPNLSQQDLQNRFQSDMSNAAALAFSATAQLNQQNVVTTREFQRCFRANGGGVLIKFCVSAKDVGFNSTLTDLDTFRVTIISSTSSARGILDRSLFSGM